MGIPVYVFDGNLKYSHQREAYLETLSEFFRSRVPWHSHLGIQDEESNDYVDTEHMVWQEEGYESGSIIFKSDAEKFINGETNGIMLHVCYTNEHLDKHESLVCSGLQRAGFTEIFGEEVVTPNGKSYYYYGDDLRESTVSCVKSTLMGALVQLGFSVKDLDDSRIEIYPRQTMLRRVLPPRGCHLGLDIILERANEAQ